MGNARPSKWLKEIKGILTEECNKDGIKYAELKNRVLADKESGKFPIKGKTPENSLYVHIFENHTKNTKSGKRNFNQFYTHINIKNPDAKLSERIVKWSEELIKVDDPSEQDFVFSEDAIDNTIANNIKSADRKKHDDAFYKTVAKARKGQSFFRDKLLDRFEKCLITGITEKRLLIASHIKPWADCCKEQKYEQCIDPENGLLLSPLWDKLFDQGYISFNDDGSIIISKDLDKATSSVVKDKEHFKLPEELSKNQKKYMEYHRTEVFGKKYKS